MTLRRLPEMGGPPRTPSEQPGLRSSTDVRLETYTFEDDGRFPNSVLPVLLYRRALASDERAADYEQLFASHGWEIVFSFEPNTTHQSALGPFVTNDGVLTVKNPDL